MSVDDQTASRETPSAEQSGPSDDSESELHRREDYEILTGKRQYTGDKNPENACHAAILRSPIAHGKISSIDLSDALAMNGVVAGYTSEDLPAFVNPLTSYPPQDWGDPLQDSTPERNPQMKSFDHWCLAEKKVRFVGEPVAVVLAEDRYTAEDALDRIDAEYERLEPVVDAAAGLSDDSSLVYEEWGDNLKLDYEIENGDPDYALEQADTVIEDEISHHRFTGTPMETRSVVAAYDDTESVLEIYDSTQHPHRNATIIENLLGIDLKVEVHAENIGGGFGQKVGFYPEELLIPALAVHCDRPVKWFEHRQEHMVATTHAREQTHSVRVGVNDDGEILGIVDDIIANSGAAYPTPGSAAQMTSGQFVPGAYTIQNYRCSVRGVATNKTPFGAHRGFGKAEASFIIERLIKIIAMELDIDPAAVRFRNFIQPDQFPYRSATGANYDSGNYPKALRKAMEIVGYEEWRDKQQTQRDDGTRIGIGMALSLDPSNATRRDSFHAPGYYALKIRVDTSGTIRVYPEDPDIGTSHEKSLSKIAADVLNVQESDIEVVQGNTAACPYGSSGSHSGRFSTMGVSACREAAEKIKAKMKAIAAENLDTSADDLVFVDASVESVTTGESLSFEEIAHIAYHLMEFLPADTDPGLEVLHHFHSPNIDLKLDGKGRASNFSTYPYAADIAVVEVDTDTGFCDIKEYVSVHDCGNQLDEKVVTGQHMGALAHGLGGILFEELPYDDHGQPQHQSFVDYMIPTANEVPDVTMDYLETPSPFTEDGLKGAGETGTISAPPTIANAMEDALRDLDVSIREATTMKPGFLWEKANQ